MRIILTRNQQSLVESNHADVQFTFYGSYAVQSQLVKKLKNADTVLNAITSFE
jgi:hypothetical protein